MVKIISLVIAIIKTKVMDLSIMIKNNFIPVIDYYCYCIISIKTHNFINTIDNLLDLA